MELKGKGNGEKGGRKEKKEKEKEKIFPCLEHYFIQEDIAVMLV